MDSAVAALSLLALMALGCDDVERGYGAPPAKTRHRGGTFRAVLEMPRSLDPAASDDVYSNTVVNQVFDGLVCLDINLRPMPAIAQFWDISTDRLHYRFFLRQHVRFHNGRDVTSADFVYSFRRVLESPPDSPSPGRDVLHVIRGAQAFLDGKTTEIEGIRAPDPHVLEIEIERPHEPFLSALASDNLKVVPREEVERLGPEEFGKHPIGTGPFRLIEWTEKEIVLRRFDEHFGTHPSLDEVRFEFPEQFTESDTPFTRFEAGRLEIAQATEEWLRKIDADGRYPVIRRRDPSLFFLGFNVQTPPLDNPAVRRALAHAIDRNGLTAALGDMVTTATGLIPPGLFGYSPKDRSLPFDRAEAKRLLREAGYPGGEGFPTLVYYTAGQNASDDRLVADFQEVGVHLKIKLVHWFLLKRALAEGWAPLFELGYTGDLTDGDAFLFTLFESTGTSNFFHYADAEVDARVNRALGTVDSRARYQLCGEAEERILKDAPLVPLFHQGEVFVVQPRVRGLALGPLGLRDVALENVWIDAGAEKRP